MKRLILLTGICILYSMKLLAQQRPQYTQYVFNNYLLNPAVSGIENYTDFKAGYRSQWTGLSGAPVTSYLTVNAPLGGRFVYGDATSMPGAGSNPYSRQYTQDYMAAEPHHGIGGMIVTDRAGPLTQTTISGTYAYHLGITSNLNVSVGVMAGLNRTSLDVTEITLENPDDPAVYNGGNSKFKPDLGLGIWAYSGRYFFGASVQQLLKQNLFFGQNSIFNASTTVPHFFFTGGYKLFLSDEIALMPSVLVKVVKPAPVNYDINMKLAFSDRFWVGGSYRHKDSNAALVGFNISSIINACYSYDFTSSNLRTVSNGTHEIVIGILFNNRYKVPSAQRSF